MKDCGFDPSASFGAEGMFSYQLMQVLINKGVLTEKEAAKVYVDTANIVRCASERGENADLGEQYAQSYETLAGWCLQQPI